MSRAMLCRQGAHWCASRSDGSRPPHAQLCAGDLWMGFNACSLRVPHLHVAQQQMMTQQAVHVEAGNAVCCRLQAVGSSGNASARRLLAKAKPLPALPARCRLHTSLLNAAKQAKVTCKYAPDQFSPMLRRQAAARNESSASDLPWPV